MPITPNTLTVFLDDNFEIDALARTVRLSNVSAAANIKLDTSYVDAAGKAYELTLDIKTGSIIEPAPRIETIFDGLSKLADLTMVPGSSPASIIFVDGQGHAQVSAGSGRVHAAWSKAPGDGLYRTLLKINADPSPILDRRIGLSARVRNAGANWFGVRLEVYATAGAKKIHIREYTGAGGNTKSLATADAAWRYDAWHWLEIEVKGASIKGRIYAEDAAAPDWQVAADTSEVLPGAFGPHLFPANAAKKVDIKRILFVPNQ